MEVGEGLKLEVYVCEIYSNAFDAGYVLVQYLFEHKLSLLRRAPSNE